VTYPNVVTPVIDPPAVGVSNTAWTIDDATGRFTVSAVYRYDDGFQTGWTQSIASAQLTFYKAYLASLLGQSALVSGTQGAATEEDVAHFLALASYPATHDTPLPADAPSVPAPAGTSGTAPAITL
jgi:hypothetical protein